MSRNDRQAFEVNNIESSEAIKLARVELLLLVGILILGTILRFYNLDYRGLWNDEYVSIQYWTGTPIEVIRKVATQDIHPPFWFLVVNFFSVFGDSDFVFRLPSAIFGSATLLLVFLAGRSLFSIKTGVFATLFLALSAFHIFHSQEARMYALYGFLSTFSIWLFWLATRSGKLRLWLLYGIITLLNLYTHYFSFLLLAAQWSFLFVLAIWTFARKKLMRLPNRYPTLLRNVSPVAVASGMILIAIGYGPWLPSLFDDILIYSNRAGVGGSLVSNVLATPANWDFLSVVLRYFSGFEWPPGLLFLVLIGIGALDSILSRKSVPLLYLLCILSIPLLLHLFSDVRPHPRYLIFCLPAFYILVARGIEGLRQTVQNGVVRLWGVSKRLRQFSSSANALLSMSTITIVLIGISYTSLEQLRHYYEYDMLGSWREIGDFLNANAQPGDAIFTTRSVGLSRYLPDTDLYEVYSGHDENHKFTFEKLQQKYLYSRLWVIIPRQVWYLNNYEKSQIVRWLESRPHVEFPFLGYDFPGAVIYFTAPELTQIDLLRIVGRHFSIPKNPLTHLALARQFASAGLTRDAIASYDEALSLGSSGFLRPGNSAPKMKSDILTEFGDYLLKEKELNKALLKYQQVLSYEGGSFYVYYRLGEIYQMMGETTLADEYRDLAIREIANPDLGEALDPFPLAANYHGGVSLNESGELGMYWAEATTAEYADIAPGVYTVRVQARGQQGCGLWPILRLYVNGQEIGSHQVNDASVQVYEFDNAIFAQSNSHRIGVRFEQPGECRQPGEDVNLFVQGIYLERVGAAPVLSPSPTPTLPPTPTPIPDLGDTLDLSPLAANYHGGVSLNESGELGMYWAEATTAEYADIAPGVYTVRVQARGQQGCGLWPILRLYVNGQEIGSHQVNDASVQVYEFDNAIFAQSNSHRIGVRFEQPGECRQPGEDVNLFVQGIYLERLFGIGRPTSISAMREPQN